MERVHALAGLGCLGVGGLLERGPQVEADCLQLGGSGLAELVVELLEGGCVLAFSGPDHRAAAVVVGDHGQIPVSLAVGDLVDPDPVDLLQAGVVELVGHDPGHDVGHRLPRTAQQPGDRGLVHPLSEPGDDVFEVAGEPGARPGPGHLLGADPTTSPAPQPADLGTQEHLVAPRSNPRQDLLERS